MRSWVFIVPVVALSLSNDVLAQNAQRPLSTALSGPAKADYDTGKLLFGDGDFSGAEIKFKAAFDKSRDARLLWNMAACEKSQRHYARTIALVHQYIDQAGALLTPNERAEATSFLDTLDPLTVKLTVVVSVAGADVLVDDAIVGTSPLVSAVVVDLGTRRVAARKPGFVQATKELTVGEEHEARVVLTLQPEGTVASPNPTVTQPPPPLPVATEGLAQRDASSNPASVRVRFTPDGDLAWTLHARDGAVLCALPCEHGLTTASGAYVEGVNGAGAKTRVDLPDALGAAGSTLDAHVEKPRGNKPLATTLFIPGAFVYAGGYIGTAVAFASQDPFDPKHGGGYVGIAALILTTGLLAGHIGWFAWSHGGLTLTPAGVAGKF